MNVFDQLRGSRRTFERHGLTVTLDDIIAMVESTDEDAWQVDVVRSGDGNRNCFFGHLHAYGFQRAAGLTVDIVPQFFRDRAPEVGAQDYFASQLWDWFECAWASTYAIYPVNDGTNPRYPQSTPKQRVLAYLRALAAGDEMTTMESMDAEFAATQEEVPA